MMPAAEILSALTAHDARVVVDGDRVRVLSILTVSCHLNWSLPLRLTGRACGHC